MTVQPTSLCQIEIPVKDLEKSVLFYEKAFGWAPVPAEMHEYIVLSVPEECGFGISLIPGTMPRSGDSIVLYFEVEDASTVVAAVKNLGGKVRFGPKKLGVYGEIHQVEDPDGNRFGLHSKR